MKVLCFLFFVACLLALAASEHPCTKIWQPVCAQLLDGTLRTFDNPCLLDNYEEDLRTGDLPIVKYAEC